MCDNSDHNESLQRDLEVWLERRRFLRGAATVGMAGLVSGCDWMPGLSRAQEERVAKAVDGSECVEHTIETAGPFPADGSNDAHGTLANVLKNSGIRRRDIRFDLGQAGEPAEGARLDLQVKLVNVNNACAEIEGYVVYLWHCDASGNYSIYNLENRSYLRGVGVSDGRGQLQFTTVVPGCYRGRYPHMHFEVYPSLEKATDYNNRILTSQLAIPASTCRAVYVGQPAYKASVVNFEAGPPIEVDGIFRDNSSKQLAAQTLSISEATNATYTGEVVVGLSV